MLQERGSDYPARRNEKFCMRFESHHGSEKGAVPFPAVKYQRAEGCDEESAEEFCPILCHSILPIIAVESKHRIFPIENFRSIRVKIHRVMVIGNNLLIY